MPPAPSKPITAAEFYDALLDTDRIVATRTAANQPDIAKRVGLLPPVALVDYLAPRLYRGGNGAGVPVKVVDFYDATEPGFDPLKHSALTTLDPVFLCLKTRCIIVNPRPNQPGEYTLEYTTFVLNVTMRVWRDGRFSQSGQQSDALWYAVKSPEAAAPEWASLQSNPPTANYNFPVKFLLRHPIAGNQLFFETKVAGVLPAPSLADGDANYLRVARETVPVPVPAGATAWTAGQPIAAGQFKFNSAAVLFYAKAGIANPQAEPFVFGSAAAANILYERAYSGPQFWNPGTAYKQGQIVRDTTGFDTALYVCNIDHTSSTTTDFFDEALTARWNVVSRVASITELIVGAAESRNVRPSVYSLQTYRAHATGTFTLLADIGARGKTKTGETFTIVITQSRTGGVTFDAGTFANQPRLSGAGGTDILRFYSDATNKLYCWSDGQGLVGGSGGTAYVLPQASPTVLGGVKGAGGTLTGNVIANADGSLSAPASAAPAAVSALLVHNGAAQNLPAGAVTVIPCVTVADDSGSGLVPSPGDGTLKIPVAGRYLVSLSGSLQGTTLNGHYELILYVNGVITATNGGYAKQMPTSSLGFANSSDARSLFLAANDVLSLAFYTDTAAALRVSQPHALCRIGAIRLA